jgi:hypothetical protein
VSVRQLLEVRPRLVVEWPRRQLHRFRLFPLGWEKSIADDLLAVLESEKLDCSVAYDDTMASTSESLTPDPVWVGDIQIRMLAADESDRLGDAVRSVYGETYPLRWAYDADGPTTPMRWPGA